MISRVLKKLASYCSMETEERFRVEFYASINKINIARVKITSVTFIILEIIMIVSFSISRKDKVFLKPNIFYMGMYIFLIAAMTIFYLLFSKYGKDIPANLKAIRIAGIAFAGVLLLWCGGISLLDQMSSGEIIVYCIAMISVAAVPLFDPISAVLAYLPAHALFIILMPIFHKVDGGLYGNYINTSTILAVSLAISFMRYKKQVEDFNLRKIIQGKNEELQKINLELETANRKLEKLSQTDGLTGIYNRFAFDKIIKEEWDRCKRQFVPLSLIMIDIDFFKLFNDNYGHQVGDDCLKQVAGVLTKCAKRSSDTIARYGGEEFAVILPYVNKDNALELAEDMRTAVVKLNIPHMYSSISENVTISLGISTVIPSGGTTAEEFIGIADKALYKAKIERNNTIAV